MFLFGRRKMRFGKRHVATEPIKLVQLPNTCIGGFISQSVRQRRTVTTNFLPVRYFTDITSKCWARGFRTFANVRGMAWLRDVDASKECVAFIFNVMASKDYTTSRWMFLSLRKIGYFLFPQIGHKISLSILENRSVSSLPVEAPNVLVG